ncbi:MAG: DsbA family protein [Candidatus Pacebacteria bacterium]|nr:DsbA family protein [Candidatus Paceibacterota bacterium]
MAVVIVGVGFFGGSLWTENQLLKSGDSPSALGTTPPSAPAEQAQPTRGTASIDDDAVLGDADAPVTIIEFSDYECPFCKRHFTDTHPKLVENYIQTGKVKLVFRDFPLAFHDPLATQEAIAANCAKEQSGDAGYYAFHDEIFARTASNGNGLDATKIQKIATDLGLNIDSFTTCLDDPAMAEEVQKDLADGSAAGASGTPSFIIGKSTSNGVIEGDLVVGAQPYATFETIIDALL